MTDHLNTTNNSDRHVVTIPLMWKNPNELSALYANHLLVTHSDNEFFLIFGEATPPIILDLENERMPESIEIKPIVKVVVSSENMEKFVNVLTKVFQQLKATRDLPEDK